MKPTLYLRLSNHHGYYLSTIKPEPSLIHNENDHDADYSGDCYFRLDGLLYPSSPTFYYEDALGAMRAGMEAGYEVRDVSSASGVVA